MFIDSSYSTVTCAPVYSERLGLSTQVNIGQLEGLKVDSCIHCDELMSLPKSSLINYVGSLSALKCDELKASLRIALDVD